MVIIFVNQELALELELCIYIYISYSFNVLYYIQYTLYFNVD